MINLFRPSNLRGKMYMVNLARFKTGAQKGQFKYLRWKYLDTLKK